MLKNYLKNSPSRNWKPAERRHKSAIELCTDTIIVCSSRCEEWQVEYDKTNEKFYLLIRLEIEIK